MIKVFLILNFIFLVYLQGQLQSEFFQKKDKKIFFYPPAVLQHITFGYKEALADTLWIVILKDIDVCDQDDSRPKSVNLGNGLDDILAFKFDKSRCKFGWVYSVIDTITNLSPKFKLAYLTGATSMSIIVGDTQGAARIYDKAILQFPNDGVLLFYASYHFLFEMQDAKKAADLLLRAAQNGAPPWTYSLAARLYSKVGQAELGRQVLMDFLKTADPESVGAKRAQMRLKEIEESLNK